MKKIAFWLTHVGVFLTLLFFCLGSFEFQRLHVRAFTEISESIAISDDHHMFRLPFQITLKNFEAEFYDNYQPKSYKADIALQNDDTEKQVLLQVNHPARFMGYDIYLSSYDRSNPSPDFVILLVVYDPWVYTKYVGIIMLLAGLFLYIWNLPFAKNRVVSWFVLLFGIGFSFMPFGAYLFGGKNLVPALQSFWFVPHIAVYMFSYGALTIACLLSIYILCCRGKACLALTIKPSIKSSMVFSLKLGTYLMGIGLLFGMLWGKTAWGNFWNFDLKETWAAIAWIAFLSVLHVNHFYVNRKIEAQTERSEIIEAKPSKAKLKTLSILIIIAYLLLQMCWFGVNYLPGAQQSLHVY